ncbi:hypothetical protein [uncultured Xanthomonas sp.]|uniref:hypothetical protein n=1 Tax=uncultured Xanthomonas sp. TaxID=152831 RepID=UPI0025DA2660|nr:hypothetical protein [uncultured Xanthomonas sp.]
MSQSSQYFTPSGEIAKNPSPSWPFEVLGRQVTIHWLRVTILKSNEFPAESFICGDKLFPLSLRRRSWLPRPGMES